MSLAFGQEYAGRFIEQYQTIGNGQNLTGQLDTYEDNKWVTVDNHGCCPIRFGSYDFVPAISRKTVLIPPGPGALNYTVMGDPGNTYFRYVADGPFVPQAEPLYPTPIPVPVAYNGGSPTNKGALYPGIAPGPQDMLNGISSPFGSNQQYFLEVAVYVAFLFVSKTVATAYFILVNFGAEGPDNLCAIPDGDSVIYIKVPGATRLNMGNLQGQAASSRTFVTAFIGGVPFIAR